MPARFSDVAVTILACDVHGPLKRREESGVPGLPGPVWVCLGWDGEGCPSSGWPMPDTAYRRVSSGLTRWPGAVRIPVPQKGQEAPDDDDDPAARRRPQGSP
jgi:hypothetical protein